VVVLYCIIYVLLDVLLCFIIFCSICAVPEIWPVEQMGIADKDGIKHISPFQTTFFSTDTGVATLCISILALLSIIILLAIILVRKKNRRKNNIRNSDIDMDKLYRKDLWSHMPGPPRLAVRGPKRMMINAAPPPLAICAPPVDPDHPLPGPAPEQKGEHEKPGRHVLSPRALA